MNNNFVDTLILRGLQQCTDKSVIEKLIISMNLSVRDMFNLLKFKVSPTISAVIREVFMRRSSGFNPKINIHPRECRACEDWLSYYDRRYICCEDHVYCEPCAREVPSNIQCENYFCYHFEPTLLLLPQCAQCHENIHLVECTFHQMVCCPNNIHCDECVERYEDCRYCKKMKLVLTTITPRT